MSSGPLSSLQRRDFLKLAGATTVCSLAPVAATADPSGRVVILLDQSDPSAASAPVKWAAGRLARALAARNVTCEIATSPEATKGSSLCIVAANPASQLARGFLPGAALTRPDSLRLSPGKLAPGKLAEVQATLISAANSRGYVYGFLELAERAQAGSNPYSALQIAEPVTEESPNSVRCVSRYFCSEIEDKPWYYDKNFWPEYLDTLAACRFNRFCFAYGLEYDF